MIGESSVQAVFVAALLTALATGLGALPLAFLRHPGRSMLGVANALAAGCMLGASAGLVAEGVGFSVWKTVLGAAAGALFIAVTRRVLPADPHAHLGGLRGQDARRALVIVAVMTVHSFTEGVGVGVSFGAGDALGTFVTIAIAVHNIPEGLAISLVMVPRGARVRSAAGWSIFSSLPQPLMAVPAFLFVEAFEPLLPAGLGFAAGAMVWMVATELLPEALEETSRRSVAAVALAAAAAMIALQAAIA
jgi:zinc transporter ZupT